MSNPSLILPQSPAYGEDYVYAAQVNDGVVPLYNVLPLTFTRASGGTRINKDGLVQNMPYNLLQYSQEIGNGIAWQSLNAIVITPNSTTAPDGTMTADTLLDVGGASIVRQFDYSVVAGQTYTFSVYLKKATGSPLTRLRIEQDQTPYNNTYIDITPTNEWVRYSVTRTIEAGITSVNYGIFPDINNGDSVYAWGAQVNIGSTAQPYLATTDRLNMPRITYPVGGGCGALLLEKQSTNEALYSDDFTPANGYWYSGNVTVTANNTTSPDGTQNADKITENTATDAHRITMANQSGSGTVTYSIFAKYNSRSIIYLQNPWSNNQAWFNIQTGVVLSSANCTASIQNMGNGWYRCIIVATGVTSGLNGFYCGLSNADGVFVYTGNGTGSAFIWGAQLEASSYATSYIPTTSTSATRIADLCSKTGISNIIGQSEGTIFWDIDVEVLSATGNENILNIDNGSGFGDTIYLSKGANGLVYAEVYVSAILQCSIIYSLPSVGRYKMALAYKANDFAFYVNGVSRGTDSSGGVPATSRLQLGNGVLGPSDGKTNEVILYTTRLTNAELATLTTI